MSERLSEWKTQLRVRDITIKILNENSNSKKQPSIHRFNTVAQNIIIYKTYSKALSTSLLLNNKSNFMSNSLRKK